MRSRRTGVLAGVALGAVGLGLTTIFLARQSAGEEIGQEPTPALSVAGVTASDLEQQYLSDSTRPDPVATGEGVLYVRSEADEIPGTLEVLAVEAGENSTHVRFSLSAEQAAQIRPSAYTKVATSSVIEFEIIAEAADLKLRCGVWTRSNGLNGDFTCSQLPATVGPDPVGLSILYPALPASVEEVQIVATGFDPITAPVTRAGS